MSDQTMFIDDEANFLEVLRLWQEHHGMRPLVTSNATEAFDLIKTNGIKNVVSDLRMPNIDGITLLENVHKLNRRLKLYLLTGYDLTPEQKSRLRKIGAEDYQKYDFRELLSKLAEPIAPVDETGLLIETRQEMERLIKMNREWTKDLVEQLEEIPEPERAWLTTSNEAFTVKDLINDIEALNERGLEHIRLWQSMMRRLRNKRRTKS